MSTLIIVCGLPGTGKTTLSKKIVPRFHGVLLRTDVIRKEMGIERYSPKEKQEVYDEMFLRAEKFLRKKRNVILDATFAKRKNRQTAKNLAKRLRVSFRIIEAICSEKIIKERIKKRRGDESEAGFKHYLEHKKFFEPIREKHVVVDTSKDVEKQLSEIRNKQALASSSTHLINTALRAK